MVEDACYDLEANVKGACSDLMDKRDFHGAARSSSIEAASSASLATTP